MRQDLGFDSSPTDLQKTGEGKGLKDPHGVRFSNFYF